MVEVKKLHMEKHYEGSNILFWESGDHSKSSQICIAFFNVHGGSNDLVRF